MTDQKADLYISDTVQIVCAYASGNVVPPDALVELIPKVYEAVSKLGGVDAPAPVELTPAVPIKDSVTPEYIICLEDGRRFKSMRRHLGQLGMTPEQYRTKWGLPGDYPIVASSYSSKRSSLAKENGLGKRRA